MPREKTSTPLLTTVLVAAVLLTTLLAAAPALAQHDPVGSYDIRGANPDGSEYGGSLRVTALDIEASFPFYEFAWEDPQNSYSGLGLLAKDGYYSVVWGSEDAACALQIFAMQDDGSMGAVWVEASNPAVGQEVATPRRQSADGISGSYGITGTNPDGSEYEGSLVISAVGDGQYLFIWTVAGDSYTGVGFPEDGWVAVVSSYAGEEGSCGQSSFEVDAAGNLSGFWWTTDPSAGVGSEVASRKGGSTLGKMRRRWRVQRQ